MAMASALLSHLLVADDISAGRFASPDAGVSACALFR